MKRSALFRALLLLTLILCFDVNDVHAQQEVIAWFDPPASQVNAGEMTTVKLIVDAQTPINSFDLTFEYDPNFVMLESWKYGDFLTKLSAIKNESTPGHLWLVAVQLGVPPIAGAGVLLEFTLRGVAPGTSSLKISQAKFADASGVQYLAEVSEGSVSVAAAVLPTATFTLEPTATFTLVPTLTATATAKPATPTPTTTPLPPTLTATATRTSIPAPQATSTAQVRATATRLANAAATSQPMATAQATLQQAASTQNPALEIEAPAMLTLEANAAAATLDALSTASSTLSEATALQSTANPELKPAAEEKTSGLDLTTAIIIFDLIVLAFIIYLLWRRRCKKLEGNS